MRKLVMPDKRFSLAVIDGDKTAYLYKIEDGIEIDQEWPDDWPEVVSTDFLKENCEQVVTA
jgi:hypothetical protein